LTPETLGTETRVNHDRFAGSLSYCSAVRGEIQVWPCQYREGAEAKDMTKQKTSDRRISIPLPKMIISLNTSVFFRENTISPLPTYIL
jgi:hypothetical protein